MTKKISPVQIDIPGLTEKKLKRIEESWIDYCKEKEPISILRHIMIEGKNNFVKQVVSLYIPNFDQDRIGEYYIDESSNVFDFLLLYNGYVMGRIIGFFEGRNPNLKFEFTPVTEIEHSDQRLYGMFEKAFKITNHSNSKQ